MCASVPLCAGVRLCTGVVLRAGVRLRAEARLRVRSARPVFSGLRLCRGLMRHVFNRRHNLGAGGGAVFLRITGVEQRVAPRSLVDAVKQQRARLETGQTPAGDEDGPARLRVARHPRLSETHRETAEPPHLDALPAAQHIAHVIQRDAHRHLDIGAAHLHLLRRHPRDQLRAGNALKFLVVRHDALRTAGFSRICRRRPSCRRP